MLYKINENIKATNVTENSNANTNNQLVQSDNSDFGDEID